ncbi:hypothetical protein D3C85_1256040 [compost metagenome]
MVYADLRAILAIDGAGAQGLADFAEGSIGIRVDVPSHQAAHDALAGDGSAGIRLLDQAGVKADQSPHPSLIVTANNSATGVRVRDQTVIAAHQTANVAVRMQRNVEATRRRTACGRFADRSTSPVISNQAAHISNQAAAHCTFFVGICIPRRVATINHPHVTTY